MGWWGEQQLFEKAPRDSGGQGGGEPAGQHGCDSG